jgi:hypothetical protein
MRRAARYDGFFPVNLEHPDQLAEVVATVTELRQDSSAPYDFVVSLPVCVDRTRGSRRVPLGGFGVSTRSGCRRIRCAACFAMARWHPEHPERARLQKRDDRLSEARSQGRGQRLFEQLEGRQS